MLGDPSFRQFDRLRHKGIPKLIRATEIWYLEPLIYGWSLDLSLIRVDEDSEAAASDICHHINLRWTARDLSIGQSRSTAAESRSQCGFALALEVCEVGHSTRPY